ncbi:helix-turn-helix domain-containing protein [Sphingomonas sp. Leaf34]|uniref:helix-turn-helix domain-containing protein n=1 Tax=unclassified Sphingomonas TaxID=196159 RepID=UPI0012E199D8|nr:helix-turn-helix domain-containing protein [Sphingomonas sp. Leaf34]
MLGRKDASARIATFLIDMARRTGGAGPRFELPVSRSEIGAVRGLTIEKVSRQMTALCGARIIALPGGPDGREPRRGAAGSMGGGLTPIRLRCAVRPGSRRGPAAAYRSSSAPGDG